MRRLQQACAAFAAASVIALQPFPAAAASGARVPAEQTRAGDFIDVQGDDWYDTPTGPVGPGDRDLLIKVRLAGLWEQPAGDWAAERGVSPKVREIGKKIADEHRALDQEAKAAARRLGVGLPDKPNPEQQGWLDQINAAEGAAFDQAFVDLLRVAHGKVFSVIAAVRAGTRNTDVRAFAETANAAVMRHMTYLESTGLVNFDHVHAAPEPMGAAVRGTGLNRTDGGVSPLIIWTVLVVGGIVVITTTARIIRPR